VLLLHLVISVAFFAFGHFHGLFCKELKLISYSLLEPRARVRI